MGWGAGSPVLPGFPPAATRLPAPGWEPEPAPQQSLWGAQVSLGQVSHLCKEAPATQGPGPASSSFLEAAPPRLLSSDCASGPAWGPGTAEAPQGLMSGGSERTPGKSRSQGVRRPSPGKQPLPDSPQRDTPVPKRASFPSRGRCVHACVRPQRTERSPRGRERPRNGGAGRGGRRVGSPTSTPAQRAITQGPQVPCARGPAFPGTPLGQGASRLRGRTPLPPAGPPWWSGLRAEPSSPVQTRV